MVLDVPRQSVEVHHHLLSESFHGVEDVLEDSFTYYTFIYRPFATNFHQASLMLEILVVMAVVTLWVVAAAKRRRKMGRYLRGNIDLNYALGTLAGSDVLVQAVQDTVEERSYVSSVKCTYALNSFTVGDGIGPLIQGVAHSDYSDAEIEEWIELTTGWAEGDLVSREIATRKIRRIGTFPRQADNIGTMALNGGRMITTKLGWILTTGQNVKFWTYNTGANPLATTDPDVSVAGHANLWPR